MYDTPFGVCCRVKEGLATTSHADHTLACLAEVGTPLSFPVFTPARQTTLPGNDRTVLHDFNLSQIEYEWSAKTLALFLPPTTRWDSTEGQTLSFDLLADRIMRERLPRGVCYGMHRLYGLMAYLRLDEETPILSPGMRERISRFSERRQQEAGGQPACRRLLGRRLAICPADQQGAGPKRR